MKSPTRSLSLSKRLMGTSFHGKRKWRTALGHLWRDIRQAVQRVIFGDVIFEKN
jgi:hypothetical protein